MRTIAFEFRLSLSWAWLLPVTGAALVFIILGTSGTPLIQRPTVMREALEVGLPIVSIFLVAPLLEREWVQGTLTQLALRRSVMQVLTMRVTFVALYLTAVASTTTALSWRDVPGLSRLPAYDVHWLLTSLFVSLVPTLVLSSLALLITHLAGSATAGYLVAIVIWIGSLLGVLLLPTGGWIRAFLLFSWSFPPAADPQEWLIGKLALLTAALVLFMAQVFPLHYEARLIRNTQD